MFEIAKILLTLVTLTAVYKVSRKTESFFLVFLIFAMWLRFVLGAFHEITYPQVLGPFSITAFFSIIVVAFGLLILPKKILLLKGLLPFYAFYLCVFISGIYNGTITGLIVVSIKWMYFLIVLTMLVLSIRDMGINRTFKTLLVAFSLPVGLQIASVLLGAKKVTDNEGLAFSYIGGYFHESGFSMILVAFLVSLSLIKSKDLKWQTILFFIGVIGIFLTNYRTAIIAALPVILIFFFSKSEQKIPTRYKPIFMILAILICTIFLLALFTIKQDRFADIGTVVANFTSLIKTPIYYTEIEKDLFSARIYIWSQYLSAFFNADIYTQIVGFGPESYNGKFEKYAHNTFVSYLYEFGFLGFASFVALNIYGLYNASKIKPKSVSIRVFYSMVGFLTLNLATMPLWALEGLIIYAILFSVVISRKLLIYRT